MSAYDLREIPNRLWLEMIQRLSSNNSKSIKLIQKGFVHCAFVVYQQILTILNYFNLSQLDERNFLPDVILLCETWLTGNNSNKISTNGYSMVKKHRGSLKGYGGAVLKNRLPIQIKV